MDGLTAKVFRTYNASMTLQEQLNKLTESEDNVNAKVLSYNRANRAVAILCNHQVCTSPGSCSFGPLYIEIRKRNIRFLKLSASPLIALGWVGVRERLGKVSLSSLEILVVNRKRTHMRHFSNCERRGAVALILLGCVLKEMQ